jgi:hypothetical protein
VEDSWGVENVSLLVASQSILAVLTKHSPYLLALSALRPVTAAVIPSCVHRLQSMEPMQQVTRLRSVRLQQPSGSQAAAAAAGGGASGAAALLDVRLAEEAAGQQAEQLVEMALAAREGS